MRATIVDEGYVYFKLHIPACEHCHRDSNEVDHIRLQINAKEMLEAAGFDTEWPIWEERTTEVVAVDFKRVSEVLNSNYLKYSALVGDRYPAEQYAHAVVSLKMFAELCAKYPNGVVKVAVTGVPS